MRKSKSPATRFCRVQGRTFPSSVSRPARAEPIQPLHGRRSRHTRRRVSPREALYQPVGQFGTGVNFTWQLDIYRQLRNARDAAAQRYVAASERRNFFVTTLVADIAENFYRLMGLDKRLENLDQIIELQMRSLEIAKARKEAARGTELGVLRFQAELQRNYSEKLIINQSIIQGENRINFLVNRYPQRVERDSSEFYDLNIHPLSVGVPSQLLQNRPAQPPSRARAGGCRARREGRPGRTSFLSW